MIHRIEASPYIPVVPTFKQWAFLLDDHLESLFGGAAGPGKSVALLASALAYADVPGYNALLLRRTYPDLSQPGALMDLAQRWLGPTSARLHDGKRWHFPSGATLSFGYLDNEAAKYQYAGAEFAFVGFDELTQFSETQYTFLFSRLRRSRSFRPDVPLRMRTASNPGGRGHEWVRRRFLDPALCSPRRSFLPARLEDNPHLNVEEYLESLAELDPVTRAQLRHGDWEIRPEGNFFAAARLGVLSSEAAAAEMRGHALRVRAWDLAASESPGADYSVGLRLCWRAQARRWLIEDVVRVQAEPAQLEEILRSTALADGPNCEITIEQEGGSSGKFAMRDLRSRVLAGFAVRPVSPTGPKTERARLAAAMIANGQVDLAPAAWNSDLFDELLAFPGAGSHDDQVDALAYAFHHLSPLVSGSTRVGLSVPTGSRSAAIGAVRLPQTTRRIIR